MIQLCREYIGFKMIIIIELIIAIIMVFIISLVVAYTQQNL